MNIQTLVPELNYWIKTFLDNSSISQKFSKLPVSISNKWTEKNSILRLLFSYSFNEDNFSIHYRKATISKITEPNILNRIIVHAGYNEVFASYPDLYYDSTSIIMPDSTSIGVSTEIIEDVIIDPDPIKATLYDYTFNQAQNIFNITVGELQLLNLLLQFKMGLIPDISNISYSQLTSSLSKLIFIFLQLELNNDFSYYNKSDLVNGENRLLSWAYEKWVLDHYYRRLKYSPVYPNDQNFIVTGDKSVFHTITNEEENSNFLLFGKDSPIDGDYIFVMYDDVIQIKETDWNEYSMPDSTSIDGITWDNLKLENNIQEGQIIYLLWAYRDSTT